MTQPNITTTFAGSGNQGLQVGHNSGSIETHFHAATVERRETPPRPSLLIPFRRDPEFVNRKSLLEDIRRRCSLPAARVALVGLGGVGKSQLAIEYCYRTAERSPGTWVFWVYASNATRLRQSFQEMADFLKIPGRKDPQADVFKLVHDWLRSGNHGPWLLVLDNADDPAMLSPPRDGSRVTQTQGENSTLQKHLSRYVPQCSHGSLIVTSRTKRAALELVEENDIIPVGSMDQQLSYDLLQKKLGGEGESKSTEISELASTLDYMPLALVQAATYIRRRAPRYSVKQYLKDYHTDEEKRRVLLGHEAYQLRRDEEAKSSIMTTLQMSFEHLQNTNRSATNLLSLMSFFDRQGIPVNLLRYHRNGVKEPSQSRISYTVNSDHEFEDDILVLKDYSFISETTANTFEMHRLVQLAILEWLESRAQLNEWREQYINRLCAEFPEKPQYEDWGKCRALYPHVRSSLANRPKVDESLKRWARLLHCAAWYANSQGRTVEGEEMAKVSLDIRKSILGEENLDTLDSINTLATAYWIQGRCIESEKLYLQVLEARRKELGERHPDTLLSMNNLASTYADQSRWKEAEQLQLQVLDAVKKELGERHADTLTAINNLATTFGNQGRWKEAEQLHLQALNARKEAIGERHPYTLWNMFSLAWTWDKIDRGHDALSLMKECYTLRQEVLGPEHPHTLLSLKTLEDWQKEENYGKWRREKESGERASQRSQRWKNLLPWLERKY